MKAVRWELTRETSVVTYERIQNFSKDILGQQLSYKIRKTPRQQPKDNEVPQSEGKQDVAYS